MWIHLSSKDSFQFPSNMPRSLPKDPPVTVLFFLLFSIPDFYIQLTEVECFSPIRVLLLSLDKDSPRQLSTSMVPVLVMRLQ